MISNDDAVSGSIDDSISHLTEHLTPKPGDENSAPEATTNGEEPPRTNGELQKTREELEMEEKAWQVWLREWFAKSVFWGGVFKVLSVNITYLV